MKLRELITRLTSELQGGGHLHDPDVVVTVGGLTFRDIGVEPKLDSETTTVAIVCKPAVTSKLYAACEAVADAAQKHPGILHRIEVAYAVRLCEIVIGRVPSFETTEGHGGYYGTAEQAQP